MPLTNVAAPLGSANQMVCAVRERFDLSADGVGFTNWNFPE